MSDSEFLIWNCRSQTEVHYIFQVLKEKNCQPVKIPFRDEGKIRTFSDKVKLREFVTNRPTLSAWLRKLSKWKGHVHRRRLGISTGKNNGVGKSRDAYRRLPSCSPFP